MPHVLKFVSTDSLSPNAHVGQGYVVKITEIDKPHPYFEKTSLKFAIEFKIKTEDKTVSITEETLPTMTAKDWNSRFYRKEYEGSDGNMYTNLLYSRYQTLNALIKIFQAKGNGDVLEGMERGEFDIDKLVKQLFDVVVILTDQHQFIDWVETFKLNGVEVPELFEEKKEKPEAQKDNTKIVEEALGEKGKPSITPEVDPDELPF